jgi:hypothetical protein
LGVVISAGVISNAAIGWELEYSKECQIRPGKVLSSVL